MSGLVFFRSEGAAEDGSYSQGRKQIGGDATAADHLCVFAIGFAEEARLIVVGSERCKRVILLSPVEEVGIGTCLVIGRCKIRRRDSWSEFQRVDRDQTIRLGEGQGPEEDAIDQTEDGSGRADA